MASDPSRRGRRPRDLARRAFLRGVGASLALPLIPALWPGRALAASGQWPKRLVVFFTPGGITPSQRIGSYDEHAFTFGSTLAPLEPWRDRLLVLDGLPLGPRAMGPGDPHAKGMGQLLTGAPVSEGLLFGLGNDNGFYAWAGGPSLDQVVADGLAGTTPIHSLQLGVATTRAPLTVENVLSYAGQNQPRPCTDDPLTVYGRLFGLTPEARRSRGLALEAVQADIALLEARLGSEDRALLDSYSNNVGQMQSYLASLQTGSACPPGDRPPLTTADEIDLRVAAHSSLLVHALACDLTRVALLQIGHGIGEARYSHLGIYEGHHAITHDAQSSPEAAAKLLKIERWFAEQFAALLERMAAVPEGDGTLLDHSVVLWCNELDEPWHASPATQSNLPLVMAGGLSGTFRTGRLVRYDGPNHNDLLTALALAMDVEVDGFGPAELNAGPLDSLT